MDTPPVAVPLTMPRSAQPQPTGRLLSLDALRGFDMFWIVGADALGGAFRGLQGGPVARLLGHELEHAEWEGFTLYDLIFPLFVFMIGISITLSIPKMMEREGRSATIGRILRRTALLYVLGLLYYGGFTTPISEFRLLGVLQRLALCYCATSLLFLYFKPRVLIAVCAGLLVGYWAMLTFIPVPGVGAGDFAEGRNFANWVDLRYLPGRLHDGTHDPEGLLSTLPAVASCILGALAGVWLQTTSRTAREKAGWLVGAGVLLICAGWLWGIQFPVIKKIWTSSYVLVAGGWSALLLGVFYLVIDVWGWRRWCMPFVWIGTNALTIYLISRFVSFRDLSAILAGGQISAGFDALVPGLGALVQALVGVGLCLWICRFLYEKKVFLRL